MTSLFTDLDVAIRRMRKNPVGFTDKMNEAVDKQEKGAHRTKHKAIALCVGVAREVKEHFELFELLRDADCLRDKTRIQNAIENNFQKYIAQGVAVRTFRETEAQENRISVYGYVIEYFLDKEIEIAEIPSEIKAMNGIDGVYRKVKQENAAKKEKRTAKKSLASHRAHDDDTATDSEDWSDEEESGEPKRTMEKSSQAADKSSPVEPLLASNLMIKMPSEELDQYLDPSLRRGRRYELEIVFKGRDEEGFYQWEYVYGHKKVIRVDDNNDNDNDANWEDEVA